MAVLFVGFLLEKLRVIHVTLVIWFLHLLLKEVSKVFPQKVPKRREFIRRIPKNPIRKTRCSNISLESLRELRTTASQMIGLTRNTVGKVYAVLRHFCKRDLEDRPIIPFGGNVSVVKCDKSQFKHKSKVSQKNEIGL